MLTADVLIVDDDRLMRTAVADTLSSAGYTAEIADGGAAALDLLHKREFDVVICDLSMPEIDGFAVQEHVRLEHPYTEVIILSAHADLEAALRCVRNGAFDLVRKEQELPELIPAVERAIAFRDLRDSRVLEAASRLIFSAQERRNLPERIVAAATETLGADDASLMLPDVNGQLYIAFSNVLPTEVQKATRVDLGDGIAGRVAASREPALLQGPQDSVGTARPVRSSIVYPLYSGNNLLGVLNLNRVSAQRRPFRDNDIQRVTVLASQVVLALENQNLIKRVTATDKFTAVGRLSTAIAHEINNPVATILANAEHTHELLETIFHLRSDGEPSDDAILSALGGLEGVEDICVALRDICDGALRIRDVIRDLRNMVRADPHSKVPFLLEDSIRSALRIATAELQMVATVECDLAEDLCIRGCRGTMTQVFVNLFMNSAYAVRDNDKGRGKLLVRSRRDGEQAIVTVEDTGRGIPPDVLARIFEPFFTTKPIGIGSGLGLSMCREIVKWHDGDMRVHSRPGKGTTFDILLPALAAGTKINQPTVQGPWVATGDQAPTVLLVDDEDTICRSYVRCLFDCHITTAASVDEAKAILAERSDFTLTLCDVLMPGDSGTALFEHIEEHYPHLTSRFVFMTGSIGFGDVRSFAENRDVPVLVKPLELLRLRDVISEYARLAEGADSTPVSGG